MSKAVIIIPTYNEAENIEQTLLAVDTVRSTLSKDWKLEVLIVDDTSPDGTADVVRKISKKLPYVSLLINPKKSGLGGAYLKGMAEAFNNMDADVIFEFDADLSHDPRKIPQFLEKIDQGYDFVLGSRYIEGGGIPDDWGAHRKFLSVVGNIIITVVLTDFSIHDWTSGYRAIKKEVYEAVKSEMNTDQFSGYTFQIGFLHKAVRRGFKIAEVPFKFVDRTFGESKLGTEYIKNTLMYILKVRIQELMKKRAFKFVMVGGLGAAIQLSSLHLFRYLIPVNHVSFLSAFQEATLLSIETAIISNFIFSNLWTFADRKLTAVQVPAKFLQFNLTSLGSLLIQFLISTGGEKFIGLFTLITLPIIGIEFDTGFFYAVVGILAGMFWNFFAYSKIIWRKKK